MSELPAFQKKEDFSMSAKSYSRLLVEPSHLFRNLMRTLQCVQVSCLRKQHDDTEQARTTDLQIGSPEC